MNTTVRHSGNMVDAISIRNRIPFEEFDYQMLLECLKGYEHPRDKIRSLLNKGVIIRVKKGLYVFGEALRRGPVSREILANLIYGPSCISLDYALQYHGMIPERVEELTSVATGRSRRFSTPLGVYSYRRISLPAFQIGMDRVYLGDGRAFLIANPEKAIADKLAIERGNGLNTQRDIMRHLLENLRVDPDALESLNPDLIMDIAKRTGSRRIRLLGRIVTRMRRKREGRS